MIIDRTGIEQTDRQAYIDKAALVMDYHNAIGQGMFSDHVPFRGFGERSALSNIATGDDIWHGTATTIPTPSSAGEQMTLVSTSANDTSAGTGVRTVDIHYLDASGNPAVEVKALNGVTPVNTVATNIRFVQGIHSETVGSSGVAAGNITIYKTGFASTVYAQIDVGGNVSLSSLRMVPNGKTFYMRSLHVSAGSNKPISIRLRATSTLEDELCSFFQFKDVFFLIDSALCVEYTIPMKFPALSIIKATAYSATAGGDASISYSGWYE